MKPLFKTILKYYLKSITKLVLFIHRPTIIAVAGSTNKTFVKEEIKNVLEKRGLNARAGINNFNTEIGLPLAVLNLPSGYNSYRKWLPAIKKSVICIFRSYIPKILILELGASSRGDMKYLLSIVKPKISIITDITQRYLENFSDMNDLAEEYKTLIKKTDRNGLVVYNYDNMRLKEMLNSFSGKKESFGLMDGSDWKVENVNRTSSGEQFIIKHKSNEAKKTIDRFGLQHVYASAVGSIIEENLNIIK